MCRKRCHVPSCDGSGSQEEGIYQDWTEFALPKDYKAKALCYNIFKMWEIAYVWKTSGYLHRWPAL